MIDGRQSLDKRAAAQPIDLEALGASLKELAADVVPGEKAEFLSRWFHSPKLEADFFIWFDHKNRIIKHQLCFFGQVVEWNLVNGTRTGLIIEDEWGPAGDEISETIHFDKDMQNSVVEQAIRVLSAVPELSSEERTKVIFNLTNSPRLQRQALDRFMKASAVNWDDILNDRRPAFWKRVKNWFLGSE